MERNLIDTMVFMIFGQHLKNSIPAIKDTYMYEYVKLE